MAKQRLERTFINLVGFPPGKHGVQNDRAVLPLLPFKHGVVVRKSDCFFYEKCLGYAAHNGKKSLPCSDCSHYESEARIETEMPGLLVLAAHIIFSTLSEARQTTLSR